MEKYENKFPDKLFVNARNVEKSSDCDGTVVDGSSQPSGDDGDMVAVYTLSFVRRLNIKTTLTPLKTSEFAA